MAKKVSMGVRLRALGFDLSHYDPSGRTWCVKCSCCEALVINGFPAHERGCSNQPKPERDDGD